MNDRLIASSQARSPREVVALFEDELDRLSAEAGRWARASAFKAKAGSILLVPGADGSPVSAVLGLGARGADAATVALAAGALAGTLPEGDWRLVDRKELDPSLSALAFLLGGYGFHTYRKRSGDVAPRLVAEPQVDIDAACAIAEGTRLARDMINTPASDMGPDAIEAAARTLAESHRADIRTVVGDALLSENLPMIHAVGRASAIAPRLIDLSWGRTDAPKVTLVGKGVAFDTGGLDIKPASGMLLMKKDMGGAANVLGLAHILMSQNLPIRLRILVPAVENAIAGNAFRPGDVLTSRQGRTVEIGNTDAEGRLILADALTLADEETPQILIDMATLTGAARVALGPDLPPFFTQDEAFAAALASASRAVADPLWRLPLWQPYAANLHSRIADVNNVTTDGFAGSITAALFLQGFVTRAATWVHFDVYGWRPKASPIGPIGGEAQGIRALHALLVERYGTR